VLVLWVSVFMGVFLWLISDYYDGWFGLENSESVCVMISM